MQLPHVLPALTTATGRFALSPFGAEHVEPLARVLEHDDIWSQGFGDGEHRPSTHEETLAYIGRRFAPLPLFAIHSVSPAGEPLFVGTTGLTEVHPELERVKVGRTVLSPAFWGAGANHEVKAAVLDWLFSCGAGRVECDVDPRNERSLRSLARFGFTLEGVRRRSSRRVDGTWRDVVVLSLLVEEWPQVRDHALSTVLERHGLLGLEPAAA